MHNIFKSLLILTATIVLAILIGFFRFTLAVADMRLPTETTKATDAVVVLTGGSERLAAGINILIKGQARKLLISGVGWGAESEKHLSNLAIPVALRKCCITLGDKALNTWGNALETRSWMKKDNLISLRIVTANYHMPRSMLIFNAVMPDTSIVKHAVRPDKLDFINWWTDPQATKILLNEYAKYVFTWLRIKVWKNSDYTTCLVPRSSG